MWYTQSLIPKFHHHHILATICEKWLKLLWYFAKYFSQNISCNIFSIHQICHSSIQYIFQFFESQYHIHVYVYIYIHIYWSNLSHIVPIYIEPGYAAQGAHVYWFIFLFSKYYWLSDLFLFQGMKYLLSTWSSFVWWHVISSVPSQMLMIKTLSYLFHVLCQSELRHSEKCCECVKMVFVGTDMS